MSERLPAASPAKSLWYQYGPQGETRALTSSTGAVADSYCYTAYGKSVSASTNDANPFQFGGKFGYYSEGNGAVLCGHRWYDTHDTFRWLSRDPIGYNGGDNLYAYCGGDPINECDEDGDKRHCHHPKLVHHPKPNPVAKRPTWFQLSLSSIDWGHVNDLNLGVLGFLGAAGGAALGLPEVPVTGGTSPILLGAIMTAAGIETSYALTDAEKEYCAYLYHRPPVHTGNAPDTFGIGQGGPDGPPVKTPPGQQTNGNPGNGEYNGF